jgi:2-polyprenyl-6-methoxyphenol hydroxylase-like FAD-dependent oxidoreductase
VNRVFLMPRGWVRPSPSMGFPNLAASRALIETTIRDLARALSNVQIVERIEVTGLLAANQGPKKCVGVKTRSRDGAGASAIAADLVVDAGGGNSKAVEWLRALGLTPPDETVVDAFAGYCGLWLTMRERWPDEWWWTAGGAITPDPLRSPYVALLWKHENDRWLLNLSGVNKQYPPSDLDGVMDLLMRLRSPLIYEMVRRMEPVSPVHSNRAFQNRWRHYETWKERLGSFLAIGDAAAVYNPSAGQGMTVAAVEATILGDTLRECGVADPDLSRKFFAAQGRFQLNPWRVAVGNDLKFPGTVGERPLAIRFLNWYREGVDMASRDPAVRLRLFEVMSLMKPLSALLEPRIMSKVIRARIRAARRRGQGLSRPISPMPPPRTA